MYLISLETPNLVRLPYLGDPNEKYQIFNPVTTETHYLEISNPKNSKTTPILTIAPEQEAAYYLKIMRHNQAKKEAKKR